MTMEVLYYITATGEISGSAQYEDDTLPATIDADIDPLTEDWILGSGDYDEDYITGGVVTERPQIVDYNEITLQANGVTNLDFVLPTGTKVTYNNATVTSTASEHFQVRSVLNGEFVFDFDPPFPYRQLQLTVIFNAV